MNFKKYGAILLVLSSSVGALPIDWSGSLGFDTTVLKEGRGMSGDCDTTDLASQCVENDESRISFQTMLLKLNPTLIVNDSTSIKGELSTGIMRGIFFGEDQQNVGSGAYFSANQGGSSLNINQLYAELYADTAVYKVGKFAKKFGLGAVIDDGSDEWDRFFSSYSGIEAHFRLGNLSFIPTWAKIDTGDADIDGVDPSGKYDVSETSIEVSYNNAINGIDGGIFYAKRASNSGSNFYESGSKVDLTLIDLFIQKSWEKLTVGLEVPMLSGDIGSSRTGVAGQDQSIDSTAYLFETRYTPNTSWSFDFNAGMVSGEETGDSDFNAMYLHPNYQIARIMFRYDLNGFQGNTKNPLASSIRNATYFNLGTNYKTTNWTWMLNFIMATAAETATTGNIVYNHEKRAYGNTVALEDQDDGLGYEVDLGFNYEWNPQINISGFAAYYGVGDYFAFDNTVGSELTTENILATGLKLNVAF